MYAVSTRKNFSSHQLGIPSYFFRGDDVYREERIVGHLPKYISRFAWYFIEHGGAITAEVTGSPTFSRDLPQGGRHVPALLEFRCEDEQLLSKCKELVAENLSGLFGNPLIADKSLLVDCANESDSDDDEYDVENNGTGTTENEQTPRQTQIQTTPAVSSTSTESAANTKRSAPAQEEEPAVIVID